MHASDDSAILGLFTAAEISRTLYKGPLPRAAPASPLTLIQHHACYLGLDVPWNPLSDKDNLYTIVRSRRTESRSANVREQRLCSLEFGRSVSSMVILA
jgi:hypothetical protein